MILKISSELHDQLLEKPESGMGYQVAIIQNKPYAVFNTQFAVPLIYAPLRLPVVFSDAEGKGQTAQRLRISEIGNYILHLTPFSPDTSDPPYPHSYAFTSENAAALAGFAADFLTSEDPAAHGDQIPILEGELDRVETHDSYLSNSLPQEIFVRYSAYPNDFRIRSDGSVLPDTYVTTRTDSLQVPSALAAIARYALPNPTPARFRFTLSPPPGTAIHCGTSAPQLGLSGGGVEVRFDLPLPAGTASGPQIIPER